MHSLNAVISITIKNSKSHQFVPWYHQRLKRCMPRTHDLSLYLFKHTQNELAKCDFINYTYIDTHICSI